MTHQQEVSTDVSAEQQMMHLNSGSSFKGSFCCNHFGRNLPRTFSDGSHFPRAEIGQGYYMEEMIDETLDNNFESHVDHEDPDLTLAKSLWDRYGELEDLSDLQRVLLLVQEAVDLIPKGHPDRPTRLQWLAAVFGTRYSRLKHEVVDLTPGGHPDRPVRLQNLALSLTDRYERLGDVSDLEHSLLLNQEVVDLTPQRHPQRPGRLEALAGSFTDRYERLGDHALLLQQEAVDLTPEGHPGRAGCLENLAVSLLDQYGRLGNLIHLERALQLAQEVVNLTPEGDRARAGRLHNLAESLSEHSKILGDIDELQGALLLEQEVLDFTPEGHPNMSDRLHCLAVSFISRYEMLGDIFDIEQAFPILEEAVKLTPEGHPYKPMKLRNLGMSLVERYRELGDIDDLARGLACYAEASRDPSPMPAHSWNAALSWAVEAYNFRPSDCSPAYLAAFRHLPHLLWLGHSISVRHNTVQRLEVEDTISTATRTCIGLGSMTAAIEILEQGVATTFQQILQLKTDVDHLPLNVRLRSSDASRLFGRKESFKSKTPKECFEELLIWLWNNVVEPVYRALELHGIAEGRLWWLPTGAFTGLPLHACSPTEHFIHSYTSTLGALLEAYSRKSPSSSPKFGVVGVTHTGPGRAQYLYGVDKEFNRIKAIIKQPHLDCLLSECATVDAVKSLLQDCTWAHLACHGTQNLQEPTKSCLLLYGGDLELQTILRIPLPNAEFAFLAACQTAKGDETLVNESFNLGGGFLAAGFRSTVGTLWSMSDADGPVVAESFYSHLFRDGRQPQATDTAEALHHACCNDRCFCRWKSDLAEACWGIHDWFHKIRPEMSMRLGLATYAVLSCGSRASYAAVMARRWAFRNAGRKAERWVKLTD
ncbi:CHAT domain-containing protein [Mycena leptocephala]|nr:CHAT domain-containing protein [Mycena leptocephala]